MGRVVGFAQRKDCNEPVAKLRKQGTRPNLANLEQDVCCDGDGR